MARTAVHEPGSARFESVTREYADALGRDPAALAGRSLAGLTTGDGTELAAAVERALDGASEQVEAKLRTASGSTRRVALELDTVVVAGQPRLVSTVRPTGSDDVERDSTPSEQREALVQILNAAPVILYRFDDEGVFREMRGRALSRLDLEPDDLLGENIFEAYADHEAVTNAARRALAGESFRYTVTIGDTTLETHYTPIYTGEEVTSVVGVSMDISELKRQRDRLDFFNSILRHDVLNGMTVIKMRAELLADELDGELERHAETIGDWCDTTTQVTARVRRVVETLSTPDEEHSLEPVDLSSILDRKVGELATAYPAATFEQTVPDGVHVEADELLSDVIGNVLTNSIEHNETDGLRVETSVERTDERVRMRIADNGSGIDDDRKESVFRRGVSSRATESGSGFGLFFVDVMVDKYGGTVEVTDSEHGGACFVIELDAGGETS